MLFPTENFTKYHVCYFQLKILLNIMYAISSWKFYYISCMLFLTTTLSFYERIVLGQNCCYLPFIIQRTITINSEWMSVLPVFT